MLGQVINSISTGWGQTLCQHCLFCLIFTAPKSVSKSQHVGTTNAWLEPSNPTTTVITSILQLGKQRH